MPSGADLRVLSDPMRAFVERIRERDYWRALVPDLTIEGSAPRQSDPLNDADTLNLVAGHFSREGYFQCDQVVGAATVARMRQAIERLHEARCPLAFCFVYDEFWSIASHLAPLLERFLGTGYRQLPDFWVWRLDPAREDAGWRPHRDKGFQALRLPVNNLFRKLARDISLWNPHGSWHLRNSAPRKGSAKRSENLRNSRCWLTDSGLPASRPARWSWRVRAGGAGWSGREGAIGSATAGWACR